MRIAVIGARGQLGAAVTQACAAGHEVTALTHADLDINHDDQVRATIARLLPAAIVNCAAYNGVDAAEDHPIDALNTNAFAVRALARAAAEAGATLVHYSTDFVFDGTASAPYSETDRPNPRSVYAASKLLGEWFAVDAPRWYVLRVESLFGAVPGARPSKGSLAAIVAAIRERRETPVFVDRTVSPTYVVDAAGATRQLIESDAPSGVYHLVNSGRCTWFEMAEEAARLLGAEPQLKPLRLADVPLRAQRPRYCALSNAKLASVGIMMPAWQDALARYLR